MDINGGKVPRPRPRRASPVPRAHLQQPRLELVVEQHVDPEELVAVVPRGGVGLGERADAGLARQDGLHDEVGEPRPQRLRVHRARAQVLEQRLQRPAGGGGTARALVILSTNRFPGKKVS